MQYENSSASGGEKVASLLKKFFSKVYGDVEFHPDLKYLPPPVNHVIPCPYLSARKTFNNIKSSPNIFAVGPDGIPNTMLSLIKIFDF